MTLSNISNILAEGWCMVQTMVRPSWASCFKGQENSEWIYEVVVSNRKKNLNIWMRQKLIVRFFQNTNETILRILAIASKMGRLKEKMPLYIRIVRETMTSSILSEFSWPLVAICTENTKPNPGQKLVHRKTSQEDCWLVPRRLPVFFSDHHLAYWYESSDIHSDQGYR